MHVLEGEGQCELDGKVTVSDSLQLGRLPRGHQWSIAESIHHGFGFKAQLMGKGHRNVDGFRPQRQPCIGNEFEL